MTLIRVDPASVQQYGRSAQNCFDEIHHALVRLVDDVVAVRYDGPNAWSFKTECGRLAAEFANRLHGDLAAMADAVRRSTSNISVALGGQPLQIHLDPRPITPPTPQVSAAVDVDTDALDALLPVLALRFDQLRGQLAVHLHQLRATDWEGHAKLAAIDAVSGFTATARQACDTAETALADVVRRQVAAVLAADR